MSPILADVVAPRQQNADWAGWLRRSPTAAELVAWWHAPDGYRRRTDGDDEYRARLVEILGRVSPRDCAATGLGCTRRMDRSCRAPEVCVRPPGAPPATDFREGPAPGACTGFYDSGDIWIAILFTGDDRHRAVLWEDTDGVVRLWVDGVPVLVGPTMESIGSWTGGRFFVVVAEGPEDHPRQSFGPGPLFSRIRSVVVYDADRTEVQVLTPKPTEVWTDPGVVWTGDELRVYADEDARDADRPDRVLRPRRFRPAD